ncbi:MAG: collagen binding domain-containing protein [Nitrososphaeraceae archaeon]
MSSKCKPDSIIISVIVLLLAFFIMQSMQHVSGFITDSLSSSSSYSSSFSSSLFIGQIANALDGRDIKLSSMNNANGTLTIVTVSNNGSSLPGATYSISSYPATGSSGNFTITDDGPEDTNRVTRGIISISRLHGGNYMVTELKAPEGYIVDKLSKVIQISANQSSAGATFTNNNALSQQQNNNSQIKSITYTAKFECGSIIGNEGPLRPGHYDTDISIFNRQEYSINILLNVIVNGGANTNAIVKTIQPQTSTGVVCKDIRQFLGMGNNSKELIEGFVIIRLDVNGGILGSIPSSGGGTVISSSPVTVDDINNFLDVHIFYTANALEFLPREILVKEIGFFILNDTSSKIPKSLLMKPLDITVQSQMNEIFDPESKIRGILSGRYNLSDNEVAGLRIKIINMSIGVAAMIDDHAISSSIVRPQASS